MKYALIVLALLVLGCDIVIEQAVEQTDEPVSFSKHTPEHEAFCRETSIQIDFFPLGPQPGGGFYIAFYINDPTIEACDEVRSNAVIKVEKACENLDTTGCK